MTFGAMEILSSDQLGRLLLAASETAKSQMTELVSQIAALSIEEQKEIRSWMTSSLTAAADYCGGHEPVRTWALEHSVESQIALARGVMLWSTKFAPSERSSRDCSLRNLAECARRASDAHKCVVSCRAELLARGAMANIERLRQIA